MKVTLIPSETGGKIKAIASKSAAHRLLICAAFADNDTLVSCEEINEDISATVRCLCALGAKIERRGTGFFVNPIKTLNKGAVLDCGESGSTMRFLVPVVCMLGADASFQMSGRLPERPLSPLREELERCGIEFSEVGSNPLVCKGKLTDTEFSISGSVSSQFISGLLFALAVSKKTGSIRIIGDLQSKPYIDLTVDTLKQFGVTAELDKGIYKIINNSGLLSPSRVSTEGDWSGAAFPLVLGAIGKKEVRVSGLNARSTQGDKAIIDILRNMGAKIDVSENSFTAYPSKLRGTDIDASQIPDLVPILAVAASVAEGRTVIYNAGRLRIKESDRLLAIREVLSILGGQITETDDGLIINGTPLLSGGEISSFGDHRIVMSAAVASVRCQGAVTVNGAEAVAKSYPSFFEDMKTLGLLSNLIY